MSIRRSLHAALVVAISAGTLTLGASGAHAAERPDFQLPAPCGETWTASTYADHNPANSVDLNRYPGDDTGLPVAASAAGTVEVAGDSGGWAGIHVRINHGGGWTTHYAHLSAVDVTAGASVSAGQTIGRVGNTGNSQGAHLHFEETLNGAGQTVTFDGVTYNGGTQEFVSKNCGAPEPAMAAGVSPIIGVGDINNTGVADYLARGTDGHLYSYMGKGDGTFTGRTDLGGGWNQYDMVIGAGDINKTGNPDLLARGTDGHLYSYMGTGDGKFTGRTDLGGGWNKYNLIVGAGDINNTGVADIIARDANGDLWAHMGIGDGTFTGPTKIGYGWDQYDTIIGAGDINKTGNPDLLARGADGHLYSYMGKGDGTFTGRTDLGGGWNQYNAITGPGDINNTGVADIIARNANGDLYSHMGIGDGTFTGATKIGYGYNIYS
ncbi:peptidoglycan DD-metalloendopeptidase family protein [Streptomyces sp. NPDC004284]|uniref:peptidoglycan DD-metalloendopeptidase family protein n=1 Tax=Streptomyces sp. NPDC004284 TaxID=3364695 RepID=UPI0036A2216D